MKNPPAYGLLDKFREVALLRALRSQECAQRQISLFGDLDVPPDGFFFHKGTYTPKRTCGYTSISALPAQKASMRIALAVSPSSGELAFMSCLVRSNFSRTRPIRPYFVVRF